MSTIVFIIFCLASVFYIPSAGGNGINLGYNVIFILCLGMAIILLSFHRQALSRKKDNQWWIVAGALCTGIPWFMQLPQSPGVVVFFLAFACWGLLQPVYLSEKNKRQIITFIFGAALMQCAIAMVQTFSPVLGARWYEYSWLQNHGRPYGIFQQVNLLASFLATGLGAGMLLLQKETRRLRIVACTAGLMIIAFVLALVQSRAGIIGAVLVVIAILFTSGANDKAKLIVAVISMSVCGTAGYWIVQHTHCIIDGQMIQMAREFDSSTIARWSILATTVKMIALKPLLGWGYGTFEYQFSRFVMTHPDSQYQFGIITHPHNELLFAWFQGGIIGLVGMLLLCGGWVKNVLRGWANRPSLGYSLLLLPLLVHLNLEYPFYQSFIHLGVFVLLLRTGEQDEPRAYVRATRSTRLGTLILGAVLVGYGVVTLFAHANLTQLERNHYVDFPQPAPWYFYMQPDRTRYDAMVALLVDFNNSRNPDDLSLFMTAAQEYSLKHNDRNVWLSMIAIESQNKNNKKYIQLKYEFEQIFH